MNSLMFLKLEIGGQVPPTLWELGRFARLFRLGPLPRWVNYRLRGCCVPNWGTALRRGSAFLLLSYVKVKGFYPRDVLGAIVMVRHLTEGRASESFRVVAVGASK